MSTRNLTPLSAQNPLLPTIGVQITGFFADPFETDASKCFGQANNLSSPPKRSHTLERLAENLRACGADKVIYHVNPLDWEAALGCNAWAKQNGFHVLLNNEAGQIYGPPTPGWQSWVWDREYLHKLHSIQPIYGLIHDEPMHHQIHYGIPTKTNSKPAIADTAACDDEEAAYSSVLKGLQDLVAHSVEGQSRFISEEVIPILYHAVARAGGIPSCKVLKEQNTTLSLTLAMSAAWQYGTNWMACVDLWEGDSGPWYQVMSKFAGHSPREFRSALEMSYLLGPECVYVESSDVLWESDLPDAPLTEFGEQMKEFALEFRSDNRPLFHLTEWTPEIIVIHPEDGAWGVGPWPEYGLLGSDKLTIGPQHLEWLKIWYHLMWGQADPARLWAYQNPFEIAVRDQNGPGGDETNVDGRPAPSERRNPNRKESFAHRIFHPLNNTAVLDQFFEAKHLRHARLIIVAGSYAPERIWPLVEDRVREGAICLCQSSLTPAHLNSAASHTIGEGEWYNISDFCSTEATQIIMPFRGSPQQWRLKTETNEVIFYAKDSSGNEIGYEHS